MKRALSYSSIAMGNNVMSRVTEDEERIEQLKEEMLEEAITSFVDAIAPLHLSQKEIIDHLSQKL